MRHACAITQSKVAHRRRIMESIQSYESAMTFAMLRLVDVLLHLREPRIHQSESSSYAFPPARKLSIAAPSDQPSPAGDSALIQNQPIRSTPAGAHPFVTRGLDPPVTRGLSPLCHPRARPACQGCPVPTHACPANLPPITAPLRFAARLAGQSSSNPWPPTLRRSPRPCASGKSRKSALRRRLLPPTLRPSAVPCDLSSPRRPPLDSRARIATVPWTRRRCR
jgi:hypothetical protein